MNRFVSLVCLAGCLVALSQGYASAQTCAVTSCHRSIIGSEKPHAPVKENDCFACHKQKNEIHPILGGKSWELTAKVPALCAQCHDAFGKKKIMHPPVKDGDCLGCHKPHGASGRFLLNVSEDQTDLCMGCHDSAPFKQKFMHGPVAVGACTKCHNPHEAAEKNLLEGPVRNLCLKCHADLAKSLKEARIVHPPVKDGPCASCHNPHGSPDTKLLKNKMPGLCVGCHAKIGKKLTGVKVPHKPLQQEGSCGSCHSPHYSQAKGLLPLDEMATCLGCHGKDNLGTPPLHNIKKELAGKKYLHGPIEMGECKACHDPHGSDNYRMLQGNYPAGIYAPYKDDTYGLCLSCHEKNLLRFAETTIYTKFRNGKSNLHYVHVVNSRKGRSCRICHQPHASTGAKLISKESIKFGVWDIPVNFTISPSGGRCAPGCHQAFTYDREKPVAYSTYSATRKPNANLPTMKKELK